MPTVPETSLWSRTEFLRARESQVKACAKEYGEEHVIDPGDEIICDLCNALIEDDLVALVAFGNRAYCGACYQKYYAGKPRKFRHLLPDGTLGPIIDPSKS